jgi:hypothetical protein
LTDYRKKNEDLGGNLRHVYGVTKGIERDIKLIDEERARIKEELTTYIEDARRMTDIAMRRLPKERRFGPTCRGQSEEVKAMWAPTEERLASKKHPLKMFPSYKEVERKELAEDLALFNKRVHWQLHAEAELRMIKERAADKLAKIEAMKAKEYQELCTFTEAEATADGVQDASISTSETPQRSIQNREIKALEGHWKVEKPQWEQVQKAQETVLFGRSQLGGKVVDQTQLSARRGPPADRPPDKRPPWKGAIEGVCLRWQTPRMLASWLHLPAGSVA